MNNNIQETLLGRLNYSLPGLKEAGKLYREKQYQACMDLVVTHFRTRTSPEYLFRAKEAEANTDHKLIEDAEEVMHHKIYGYQFPGDIDWSYNPTEETTRDNEWSWSLYRHIYWQPLARAYALTKDERYTKEFLHQMRSFVKAWPVGPFMDDPEYEKRFTFPGHAWRTIETAMRVYTSWLPCMEIFRKSKVWDTEDWVLFLSSVCDHADYLMTHYSNHCRSSNWLTMEAAALFECGMMFPEIKSDWLQTGYQRVMHEIKYSFDNDGIHMERTPVYHLVAAGAFLQVCRLCMKNHIVLPPYALPTLEKAAEFLESLVKPDATTPMIGDADREDLRGRRCDTSLYEGMNLTFDPVDLNEIRAFFRTMYEITGRGDFLYFASGALKGRMPDQRNYEYKSAGIYVMRTGWTKEDSYFHVHGTQLELGEKSSHSHNDTGHIELQIKGEDILSDSGRYVYNSSCKKDVRHYFLSAKAHNTLYADDHEMGKVPDLERVRGVRTFCHHFLETADYQWIDISHNGYIYTDDPLFHRRSVIHLLQSDTYIIDDRITGPGLKEHDMRLFFNFGPGVLEQKSESSFLFETQAGKRRYQLTGIGTREIKSEILFGSDAPIGGWVSYGYALKEPIYQLDIMAYGKAPFRFITVIAPDTTGVSGQVSMEKAELDISGGQEKHVCLEEERVEIKNRRTDN